MKKLSDNAVKVLESRYLLKDAAGNITESPEDLFKRISKAVALAELKWSNTASVNRWDGMFFNVMSNLLFLPNSPTLMNGGINNGQLSACFVLPVEDNLNSIFTTLKNTALIHQSGGGTGFNFSKLRPKGDLVIESGGYASGPVSFMKIFDVATECVKQGGKRRGANMGVLNVDHPDVEAFINCKQEQGSFQNFNISVGITDPFMQAVELNEEWSLINPNNKSIVKKIKAKSIWDAIVNAAWKTGDPGLLFMDTINNENPTPAAGSIEATNPCGEVPLLSYEACNLGSINISKFVTHSDAQFGINWNHLEEVIDTAVRFLDNVIEINNYVIPEIKKMVEANRKIGLGIMGWANLLASLNIPYESHRAIHLAELLMEFVSEKSREASIRLAHERGVFPNWKNSIYDPGRPIRNATRTCIAPTGSISIIANTSPSIEPFFALAFERRHVIGEETLGTVNQHFIQHLLMNKLYSEDIVDQVLREGVASNVAGLPAATKFLFKTALEISPEWHLNHLLAFQKYTDNAVSKTINLPENATTNEIDKIFKTAWKGKVKGITVFRHNSTGKQVIHHGLHLEDSACRICFE